MPAKPTPEEINVPDLPQQAPEVVTAKDRVLQVQQRFDAAQSEVFALQQKLDQLKFIQQQLLEGQALEDPDAAALEAEGIDAAARDMPAKLDAKIEELSRQEQEKRAVMDQTNSRLEALRKQLSPEDELFLALDQASSFMKKENVTMKDALKAFLLVLAAIQKYFKYLTGELDKAMGKITEPAKTGAEVPGITGTPAEHTRRILRESGETSATTLKQKKTEERDRLQAGIPAIEKSRDMAKGGLVTAEERLKTLRAKSDTKTDDLRTAESAVDTARREVDQLNRDLADAQKKFEQAKADLTAIDSAVAACEQMQVRLKDVLMQVLAKLPATGDLAKALAALEVKPGANGIDIALGFKTGMDMPKLLKAFNTAGVTNLDTLGVNAATNEVTSPLKFIEAMQKVALRAVTEVPKPTV
jgi:chromosome segregation ATPase